MELLFLGTGLEMVGLPVGDVLELLRAGFAWVPIVGLDAGSGFSWVVFWTEGIRSWGVLAGAWDLSAGWAEDNGGSAFSRPSEFTEVSEK